MGRYKDYVTRSQNFGLASETLNDATYLDQFITGKETEHEKLDYKWGLIAANDGAKDNPTGNEGYVPFWRMGAVVNIAMYEIGDREKPDWTTNLQTFDTKVLFTYSERNKAYGLAHAQRVSSAYRNVQLERIDGAGHDLITFSTGWNNFFPIALNYLNEIK